MTPEQQKEELSRAYLYAVAARCGFAVGSWSQDQDAVDVTIAAAGSLGGGVLYSPKIDVQLKCTSASEHVREDHVWWQLDRQAYDRLRARKATPQILVVLVLPTDPVEWLEHSVDALVMRRCAYWISMKDKPPTDRDSTIIKLPRTQIFSPDQLQRLMEKVSREEVL